MTETLRECDACGCTFPGRLHDRNCGCSDRLFRKEIKLDISEANVCVTPNIIGDRSLVASVIAKKDRDPMFPAIDLKLYESDIGDTDIIELVREKRIRVKVVIEEIEV